MPIYTYQCTETNEIKELILPLSDSDDKLITCPIHCRPILEDDGNGGFMQNKERHYPLHNAEKIPSRFNTCIEAKPTLVFKNPITKEVKLMNREKDKFSPPKGFIVEEVRGQHARLNLEKELSEKQHIENQVVTERHREIVSASKANRHSEINSNINGIVDKSENPSATAALLKKAMNRSRKKELPAKKTEFRFDVNHIDNSNLTRD